MTRATLRSLAPALVALSTLSCGGHDDPAVREMRIEHVDCARAADGAHRGTFAYGGFTYVVQVWIQDRRIDQVVVLANRSTYHSRRAEAVLERVLDAQSPAVPAVTGATVTSKALLKAVERALRDAAGPQESS